MNTLTTILTIMALLAVAVFVIRYIRGREDNIPTPTSTPVSPTPTPTSNIPTLNIGIVTLDRSPLSIHIDPSGNISSSPFYNGVISGSALNELAPMLNGVPSDYYYRIVNLFTSNTPDFSTPSENTDISMTTGATFKLVTAGRVGDAHVACDMVIYDSATNDLIVSVSVFINIIADRV